MEKNAENPSIPRNSPVLISETRKPSPNHEHTPATINPLHTVPRDKPCACLHKFHLVQASTRMPRITTVPTSCSTHTLVFTVSSQRLCVFSSSVLVPYTRAAAQHRNRQNTLVPRHHLHTSPSKGTSRGMHYRNTNEHSQPVRQPRGCLVDVRRGGRSKTPTA